MTTNRCIKNLLRLINLLQENSQNKCRSNDGCLKPYLGPTSEAICYNTRVITLYTKNGTLFTAPYFNNDNLEVNSSLFRVEKVNDDCVTLLILREENGTYLSTNNFITVNLNCVCAIKCIVDTVVENL